MRVASRAVVFLVLPQFTLANRFRLSSNATRRNSLENIYRRSEDCNGDGSKLGAAGRQCGKVEVSLELPRGSETHSVQMYCYDRELGRGKKARSGTIGQCLIPRTDYCSEDAQCRPGSTCKVSNTHGQTTCEEGVDAGDICAGTGSKYGGCAKYSWVRAGIKWNRGRLYCVDPSSRNLTNWKYAREGDTGICKVWKDSACSMHEDCWFGLFCSQGTCKHGDANAYAAEFASLVVHAATLARESGLAQLNFVSLASGIKYDIFSPFGAALQKDGNVSAIKYLLDSMLQSVQDAFVTASPASFTKTSRSGSSFYWSSDRRWILKQLRDNEFAMLISTVHERIAKEFAERNIWFDTDSGVLRGSLLNVPVLAISPGNWMVIPNVVDRHQQILRKHTKGDALPAPIQFDVKPMPARSDERHQLLAYLLTGNGGNGVEIETMHNFYSPNGTSLSVWETLQKDILILDQLHLVDYSILMEVYDLVGKGAQGVDLGYGCFADSSCSSSSPQSCLLICITIIDWLRPFVPGNIHSVDLENKLKGGKFTEYGKKTELTWECIAKLGHGYSYPAYTRSGVDRNKQWVALGGKTIQPHEFHITSEQEVEGLIDDPCTQRWNSEHGLDEVDLIADACKTFVRTYAFEIIRGEIGKTCVIFVPPPLKQNKGICSGIEQCRVTKSCVYAMGHNVSCEDIAVIGTPHLDTVLHKCSHYISKVCHDRYRHDYLSEAQSQWTMTRA